MGQAVGANAGSIVGGAVCRGLGARVVGVTVGSSVGGLVGEVVDTAVGSSVGTNMGWSMGWNAGIVGEMCAHERDQLWEVLFVLGETMRVGTLLLADVPSAAATEGNIDLPFNAVGAVVGAAVAFAFGGTL